MEWYEHKHDHEGQMPVRRETDGMSACERLALRLSRFFGMPHCHLASDAAKADRVAIKALFAPELGERSALAGDEIIVIAAGESAVWREIVACGGCPILLRPLPGDTVTGAMLEERLSLSTRAVVVDHTAACLKNPRTVRNFCNKYDLWMLESVGRDRDMEDVIDGHRYRIGALGDWSSCRLCRADSEEGTILTRDEFISYLIGELVRAEGATLSDRAASELLRCEGACL